MAENTTVKKKKAKRIVPKGQLHIKATFNNTIVTVTDNKGEVIASSSAGACGFRGSKKGTAYAAQVASEKVLTTVKQTNSLNVVDVFINGIGQGRDAAIRAAMTIGIDVESITDKTGVPHGGVRPRKVRHP
ncbi:30S ribosomal protein S11 [Candidatus Saccharibacteria bacterium]|jgi:small subunit ribosomal protein S11|nr:30S ribosomal protein S11 [Candidatus Saccharibacteria bacterium]MCA9313610.1 30S ribosomal protein S11 [Candidatus Saccharibacteria bacterium]